MCCNIINDEGNANIQQRAAIYCNNDYAPYTAMCCIMIDEHGRANRAESNQVKQNHVAKTRQDESIQDKTRQGIAV